MSQLSVIRSVQSRTLPALTVQPATLPQQTESNQLLKLMEAMITCLESHRRDELVGHSGVGPRVFPMFTG